MSNRFGVCIVMRQGAFEYFYTDIWAKKTGFFARREMCVSDKAGFPAKSFVTFWGGKLRDLIALSSCPLHFHDSNSSRKLRATLEFVFRRFKDVMWPCYEVLGFVAVFEIILRHKALNFGMWIAAYAFELINEDNGLVAVTIISHSDRYIWFALDSQGQSAL